MLPLSTHTPRLLLADDDDAIRANLGAFLSRAGFDVASAADGEAALAAAASGNPELIVLDVMMPRIDGREVLRRLRARGQWTPVVLLTQIGESYERAAALEEGADDYLNKPFDPQELVARIRAILRRTAAGVPSLAGSQRLTSGRLGIDRMARRAWVDSVESTLTPKAFALLEYLMTHPDEVIARDRLLTQVWGYDFPVTSRAVDHRIAELRRALEDDSGDPVWLETVQGIGYRFLGRVERG
jgi:DNA-binding response OmpR family regulator